MEARMTPKERVMATIAHEEADKVPLDCWLAPEIREELNKTCTLPDPADPFALQKFLGHDLLYRNIGFCESYQSIYDDSRRIASNLYEDRFGIRWRKHSHGHGSYCEFVEHPLADADRSHSYTLPDPLESSKRDLDAYRDLIARDGDHYAIIGGVACTVFEAAWYLRGLDRFLMDLLDNRDFAEELLDSCMSFSLTLSRELVRMGVDIVWWGDDLSLETGPLFSPDLVRELIFPRYAHMVSEVKAINPDVRIAFHSDGHIEWLLDDLVEMGIDIINPLQPDANDVQRVKRRYGKNLTYWGNVDTRTVMSSGTTADVIREVERVIRLLGDGGGLILCSNHTVQAGPKAFDNTLAYYFAAEKYRS